MTDATAIREHLIDRLEPLFGKPRNADGLAAELAKHAPDHVTATALGALADSIIASRKAKGFPSAAELIGLVKILPAAGASAASGKSYISDTERERKISEAEDRARRLLNGTELARRAVEERWAPGLIEFARDHGRAPGLDEERPIIALAHKNDALATEHAYVMGGAMVRLRELMHWRAARDLGFNVAFPQELGFRPKGMRTRTPPAMLPGKPVTFTAPDAALLAPTPALLATLAKPAREAAE